MRTIILTLFALLASALANSDPVPTPIAIVKQSQSIEPDGSFKSDFETANGISEQAEGTIKKIDKDEEIQVIKGSVSWTAPDGSVKKFTYIADENGYQPEGDFLPTSPPIPLPIARALEYANAHPEETTTTKQ